MTHVNMHHTAEMHLPLYPWTSLHCPCEPNSQSLFLCPLEDEIITVVENSLLLELISL
uniref:Uncharacterized protein n=1 Tax=Arundo donax TaxID=35708 RepID=A0A0A9E1Y8_ARUDO